MKNIYEIKVYEEKITNKEPFTLWFNSLDKHTKSRIALRLNNIRLGNLGDIKSVGDGVNELRFKFGAVYRIYFGIDGQTMVILLCGGDKDSQYRDIKKAKQYWKDYNMPQNERKKENEEI